MLVLIDNYDSFTYNLVQYFQCLGQQVHVVLNDQISLEEIAALRPSHLVISPGPNAPNEAGISLAAIHYFSDKLPILGICLGHQALAQAFGASIIQAPEIMHGKISQIAHTQQKLFRNLPRNYYVTRYHSLTVDPLTLPACFSVDAHSNNTIMAISHRQLPLFGVQFHPEAILTEFGMELLSNFLTYTA